VEPDFAHGLALPWGTSKLYFCLQAAHGLNFVRFFTLFRAPTTPYLFACVMSKFVEHMRREAFRLMSVTYGMRQKQDQYHRENSINDQYPLDSLTQLLCFEDSNEARETCKWYNITVRNVETRSSTGERQTVEYIFWQDSKFVVPRGPLKPKKKRFESLIQRLLEQLGSQSVEDKSVMCFLRFRQRCRCQCWTSSLRMIPPTCKWHEGLLSLPTSREFLP